MWEAIAGAVSGLATSAFGFIDRSGNRYSERVIQGRDSRKALLQTQDILSGIAVLALLAVIVVIAIKA